MSEMKVNIMQDEDFKIFRVYLAAKANETAYCSCPGTEPGKINIDVSAHLPGCWVRKRLLAEQFTVDTYLANTTTDML